MSSSRILASVVFGLALITAGSSARADIQITVTPSLAPNVFGSPSWPGYVSNALTALENNQSSSGTPNNPTYYQALANGSSIGANQIVVTGFPSWLGLADPGTAFGSQFASELGNRLHFGLQAIAPYGTTFSLSQLTFNMTSSDPGNTLAFSGGFTASDNYSSTRVGVVLNPNGTVNHFVTSGSATQLVNELFYVGVGNAYAADSTTPGATNQDKINNVIASIPNETVSDTYSIGQFSGSGSVNVFATPEPSTLTGALIAVLCLAGFGGARRLRRTA
jgi:hypothetical protein